MAGIKGGHPSTNPDPNTNLTLTQSVLTVFIMRPRMARMSDQILEELAFLKCSDDV